MVKKNNVIESPEILLEVGIDPEMPNRLIGDRVLIIPSNSKLILSPKDLEDRTLSKMEQIASQILELLKHTPISAVGINYGYRIEHISDELRSSLPTILGREFAQEDLTIHSREYKWTCPYDGQILNITCQAQDEEANIFFNFHAVAKDTESAAQFIRGKVIQHRNKTRSILNQVFNVSWEE